MLTIYRDLRAWAKTSSGNLLDVGCGAMPYKHLFKQESASYTGIDVKTASDFGYRDNRVVPFDGITIPFPDHSYERVICTEVLEHTPVPELLAAEIHRVLKPGGKGFFTIPWSARVHYKPFDYQRFTPYRLEVMMKHFSGVRITARGNDLAVITNKLLVLLIRLLAARISLRTRSLAAVPLRIIATMLLIPPVVLAVVIAHMSLLFPFGSSDDPLGYTVCVTK